MRLMAKKKTDKLKRENKLSYRQNFYKGQKAQRGKPIYYDEVKERISVMLTPTSINILNIVAEAEGLSRSEYLERLLRKIGSAKQLIKQILPQHSDGEI